MRITSQTGITKSQTAFKSIWNNKAVLKGLEMISDHSASFVAATTFVMASGVKPLSISLTPNVKKENKQHAIANSVVSGLVKFSLAELIAIPIESGIKKIDKNPNKYLSPQTVNTLKAGAKSLEQSQNYKFASQVIKQTPSLITAIPKSMITVALMPLAMKLIFGKKENSLKNKDKYNVDKTYFLNNTKSIFDEDFKQSTDLMKKNPSFKGILTETTAKGAGKLLNMPAVQNLAKKFSGKSADITRNMSIATDILLTASFAHRTLKSEKIEQKRKKPLIFNNLISTAVSVIGGFSLDGLVKKSSKKFMDKFTQINKDNPKLNKYIEGINVLRPTLIFAGIYYGILPLISTYLAEKTDKSE